jgi:hypothetical protein
MKQNNEIKFKNKINKVKDKKQKTITKKNTKTKYYR